MKVAPSLKTRRATRSFAKKLNAFHQTLKDDEIQTCSDTENPKVVEDIEVLNEKMLKKGYCRNFCK